MSLGGVFLLKQKKWMGLLLSVVMVAVLSACSQSAGAGAQSTLEKAKAEGKIVVGFANENPYAYETADGQLTGEAVEVARAIFKEIGIDEMEGKLVDFGSLISGLQAKQFDAITAGMFVNPDRCKEVAFADPEYRVGESLGVNLGNPKNLHSFVDVAADPSVKVGVMVGAIEIEYMKAAGVADNQIEILNDQPAVIAALKADRVDAITMTGPSLQAFMDSDQAKDVERVMDFKQPVVDGNEVWGYGATAFRLGDEEFQKAFSAELKKLKESGKLLEIISEFGFTEAELPGDITAAQLCGK
jgi:polar amino acid transport system substrate-binding protein